MDRAERESAARTGLNQLEAVLGRLSILRKHPVAATTTDSVFARLRAVSSLLSAEENLTGFVILF
jgi:hypothetical protein